mgnify:FL=1
MFRIPAPEPAPTMTGHPTAAGWGTPASVTSSSTARGPGTPTIAASANNNSILPGATDTDMTIKLFTTIGELREQVKAIRTQTSNEIAELKRQNRENLESVAKRRKTHPLGKEFSDPDPEDSSWQTNVDGELDNGSTTLPGMSLRTLLKPPNVCPSMWPWGRFPDQVSIPKRSTSLVLEHLTGSKRPHNLTIYELHERALPVKLKKLLSKNGAPGQEPEFKFRFSDQGDSELSASSSRSFRQDRDWKLPDSCHDVMDGVLNYGALVSLIRPWSYEASKYDIKTLLQYVQFQAWALLRALHESRFFFNVAPDSTEQKKLLAALVDNVFADNTSRAQARR